MKIDIHVHLHGKLAPGLKYQKEDDSRIFYSKKLGIQKICVSILPSYLYVHTPEEFSNANKELFQFMRKYPEIIYGYCYINPCYFKKAMDELSKCVLDYGMIGLKLGAGYCISDPKLTPFIEKCIKFDIPILQHTIHHISKNTNGGVFSDSTDVACAGKAYPEAKIIMAHVGGGGDWEWAIKAIKNTKNVYLDTSGSGVDSPMIETAIAELGADRLLFGTDITIFEGISKIEGANISKSDKEKIYYKNAQKLFKLGINI